MEDDKGWQDGKFPDTQNRSGVGATGDEHDVMRLAAWDTANGISIRWGLGPAIWDNAVDETVPEPAISGPSAAHIGGGRFIIAYTRKGGSIAVRIFDDRQRRFLDPDFMAAHALNSEIASMPSVAYMNGRVFVAWVRNGSDATELCYAVGTVGSNLINWTQFAKFAPPPSEYIQSFISAPSITEDGARWYLAVAVKTQTSSTGASLTRNDVIVYSSSDAASWSTFATRSGAPLGPVAGLTGPALGLAGRTDGQLLLVMVGANGAQVHKYAGSSWSTVPASTVFGVDPGPVPFGIVGVEKK
jgi:hypothetical protein